MSARHSIEAGNDANMISPRVICYVTTTTSWMQMFLLKSYFFTLRCALVDCTVKLSSIRLSSTCLLFARALYLSPMSKKNGGSCYYTVFSSQQNVRTSWYLRKLFPSSAQVNISSIIIIIITRAWPDTELKYRR